MALEATFSEAKKEIEKFSVLLTSHSGISIEKRGQISRNDENFEKYFKIFIIFGHFSEYLRVKDGK